MRGIRPVLIALATCSAGPALTEDRDIDPAQLVAPFFDLVKKSIEQKWQEQQNTLTQNQIIVVQQLLAQRGYDVGQPDGIIGPKTMAVVAQLQSKAGIAVTGIPDRQLLEALLQNK